MSPIVSLIFLGLGISCVSLCFLAVDSIRFKNHIESEMKRLHGDYRDFETTSNTGLIETFELEIETKEPK